MSNTVPRAAETALHLTLSTALIKNHAIPILWIDESSASVLPCLRS